MAKTKNWSQEYMDNPDPNPDRRGKVVITGATIATILGAALFVGHRNTSESEKPTASQEAVPVFIKGYEYTVNPGDNPQGIDQQAYPDSEDHLRNGDKILDSLPDDEFHSHGLQPGDKVIYPSNAKFSPRVEAKSVMIHRDLRDEMPFVVPVTPNNGEPVPKEYGVASEIEYAGKTRVVPAGPPQMPR